MRRWLRMEFWALWPRRRKPPKPRVWEVWITPPYRRGKQGNPYRHSAYVHAWAARIARWLAGPGAYIRRNPVDPWNQLHCPKQRDEIHCEHWWDGEECCSCGAPADPNVDQETGEERRAQAEE